MTFHAALIAGVALVAFGVGVSGTHYVMRNAQNAKELAIYEAGRERMAKAQGKVDEYQAEITRLRERKPRVVRYCPSVPAAPGRPDEAGAGVADAGDIGPVLRTALDELIRCNKLRESVK